MPEATPTLNHADFATNSFHTNGFLHLRKKDGRNNDLVSTGYVRGSGLATELAVKVTQGTRLWTGKIVSGPNYTREPPHYEFWTFSVTNSVDMDDPIQQDSVTVTVTNSNATPPDSNPQPSQPQPTIVDP
jgi:hypothetical protein